MSCCHTVQSTVFLQLFSRHSDATRTTDCCTRQARVGDMPLKLFDGDKNLTVCARYTRGIFVEEINKKRRHERKPKVSRKELILF